MKSSKKRRAAFASLHLSHSQSGALSCQRAGALADADKADVIRKEVFLLGKAWQNINLSLLLILNTHTRSLALAHKRAAQHTPPDSVADNCVVYTCCGPNTFAPVQQSSVTDEFGDCKSQSNTFQVMISYYINFSNEGNHCGIFLQQVWMTSKLKNRS